MAPKRFGIAGGFQAALRGEAGAQTGRAVRRHERVALAWRVCCSLGRRQSDRGGVESLCAVACGGVVIQAFGVHRVLELAGVVVLRCLPEPPRTVNPNLHLTFVDPLVGALAAAGFALLGGENLAALLIGARRMLVSGFSPMWGGLPFPLAAYAGALFAAGWEWPGHIVIIGSPGLVPWSAFSVPKMRANGRLAQMTNAAKA